MVKVCKTLLWMGQSTWLQVCHDREEGPPPPVDLTRALLDRIGGERLSGTAHAQTLLGLNAGTRS